MMPAGLRLGVRLRAQWDRALVAVLAAAFVIVVLSGRQQLATSTSNSEQVAFLISGGFGGLFLLFVAITVLLVAELRDTGHKLDRIDHALRGEPLATPRQVLAHAEAGESRPAGRPTSGASGTKGWLTRPALVCGACWILGGVLVTGGWLTAAGTGSLARAMDGLALAAAGFTLAVAGLVSLSLGLGIGRARRLRRLSDGLVDVESNTAVENPALGYNSGYWSAAGLRRFHRWSCVALVHAEGSPHLVDVSTSDLEPCLICHDDLEGVSRHE
jgi:hypothetical protein